MSSEIQIDYENVYNSSPDMCLSLEPISGKIIACNRTLLDSLGYTKAEVLNATLFDLYASSEYTKVVANLSAIKRGHKPLNKEFIVRKKNGEFIEVTLKLNFVKNRQGIIKYTNAVWRDVRELKAVQKQLIEEKNKVQEKNERLESAVRYAQLIQNGTLPKREYISNYLPKSFVFFRPKDIVSGDFYNFRTLNDLVLFSVFDCTGHGIPSALISMLGSNLLHQIIIEKNCSEANEILDCLRSSVIQHLNQGTDDSTSDGMDGGICVLNKNKRIVQFSGANTTLILVRTEKVPLKFISNSDLDITTSIQNNEATLYAIKGNKQPIGYYKSESKPFDAAQIQLCPKDRIFLYSDGFKDQFGGKKGKKFLTKRFYQHLLDSSKFDIDKQAKSFNTVLENWQGDYEQTDDICVFGVSID